MWPPARTCTSQSGRPGGRETRTSEKGSARGAEITAYMHAANQASAPVDEEVPLNSDSPDKIAHILHLIQSTKSLSNNHQASRNRLLFTRINLVRVLSWCRGVHIATPVHTSAHGTLRILGPVRLHECTLSRQRSLDLSSERIPPQLTSTSTETYPDW